MSKFGKEINSNKNGINENCNCDSPCFNGVWIAAAAGNASGLSKGAPTDDEGKSKGRRYPEIHYLEVKYKIDNIKSISLIPMTMR